MILLLPIRDSFKSHFSLCYIPAEERCHNHNHLLKISKFGYSISFLYITSYIKVLFLY